MSCLEKRVSPARSTLGLQQQHVTLGQGGWQVAPQALPKHGTVRSPSPSQVLADNGTRNLLTERYGVCCSEALTRPLLEQAGAPESNVSLKMEEEEEEEENDDRPPKHLLYASYVL